MTRSKKLKRRIRSRARKTGESYTSARARLLVRARPSKRGPAQAAAPARPATRGVASPERVLERTGETLDHWFSVLDAFGAAGKGHTAAARHLGTDHGVDAWYAQGITVAYERARGLRAPHQRASGDYEVSVSKVVPATAAAVAAVFDNAAARRAWLLAAGSSVAASLGEALKSAPRMRLVKNGASARLRSKVGDTAVAISVDGKTGSRSSVVATIMKLRSPREVEEQRAAWRRILETLRTHLAR